MEHRPKPIRTNRKSGYGTIRDLHHCRRLAPEDTNGVSDIFDTIANPVKTDLDIAQLDSPIGSSFAPTMSADGRLIAFESYANFGVAADRNSYNDVYLVEVGQTPELVSVDPNGVAGNSGSATPAISSDRSVHRLSQKPTISSWVIQTIRPTSSFAAYANVAQE